MFSVDAEQVPTTKDHLPPTKDHLPPTKDHLPPKREYSNKEDKKSKACRHKGKELREEFHDAAIFYSEIDYKEVDELVKILKREIVLENGEPPKIDLCDVISPTGEMFSQIEILLQKCSCLIIYLTDAFLKDRSLLYQTNELFISSVKNQSINSGDCQLVLLSNTPRNLPTGMKSLCMTKWYINQELALRKLKCILQKAQNVRKMKELQNWGTATSEESDESSSHEKQNNAPIPMTTLVNITATNVQIGDNAKMFGTNFDPVQRFPEKTDFNIRRNQNPESETMPYPESETRPCPESKTMPYPESETMPHPKSETKPCPESKTMPYPESKTMPCPKSETLPCPESKTMPYPESETLPCPESETSLRPESETLPRPESETLPRPESETLPRPESEKSAARV